MKLELIGLNHRTSALETRDRAAIGPERLREVTLRLLRETEMEGVVVVSTCNRVELYLSPTYHNSDDRLRAVLMEVCGLTSEEAGCAYVHRDADATRHLFKVAAGLDSQLVGEVQILGQVKDAYHRALELASSCSFLNGLFLRAIECGKMVRHRTGISQGAVSVAYAAIELARRVLGRFEGRRVLLVGAGDTIKLATKYIAEDGDCHWRVSNRTASRAEALAEALGGVTVVFPPRTEDLAWADLVVAATSSPDLVVTAEESNKALAARREPLLMLDLAVPRDIDINLKRWDNVYLYSVDDFQEMVAVNLRAREKEAVRAEKLVEKQLADFVKWYQENRVAPTIQQLQLVLEEIRSAEVDANARRFCTEDREQLDKFSRALVRKVSGLIIANMKRASVDRNDLSLARAVAMTFVPSDHDAANETLEKLEHERSH